MFSSPSNQKPTTMLADVSQITIPQGPFPTLSLPLSVSISTAKDLGSKHTLIILDPGFTLEILLNGSWKIISYLCFRVGFKFPKWPTCKWEKNKFTRFTCSSTSIPHMDPHGGCLFPTPQKMHNPRFKSHEPSHRHLSSIGLHRGASIGQAGAPHLSSTSQWNQRVKSHLSPLGLVSIYVTSFDMVMNCHFLVMKSHVLLFNHVVHI